MGGPRAGAGPSVANIPSKAGFACRAPHADRPRFGGGGAEAAEWETVNEDALLLTERDSTTGPLRADDAALLALVCDAEYDEAAEPEPCATKKAMQDSWTAR